jgi:methoxymalonate biosynthesis acyl carrier protein
MSTDRDAIRVYVTERTGQPTLADDTDLFETGLVSSLFAVQVVMWLERVLHVPVVSEDLDLRNFSSIAAIAEFVARKLDPAMAASPSAADQR